MHVMILGNWSDCVGTDYCEYLGEYDSLADAEDDARIHAIEKWEPQEETDDDGEPLFDDEGPDYYVEEYIPGDGGHDMQRAGGGSFMDEINR